jgi:hypothetical protein
MHDLLNRLPRIEPPNQVFKLGSPIWVKSKNRKRVWEGRLKVFNSSQLQLELDDGTTYQFQRKDVIVFTGRWINSWAGSPIVEELKPVHAGKPLGEDFDLETTTSSVATLNSGLFNQSWEEEE